MKLNKKIQGIFKLWLLLYRLENFIWNRYSQGFMMLNEDKDFSQYHYDQPDHDDIPF